MWSLSGERNDSVADSFTEQADVVLVKTTNRPRVTGQIPHLLREAGFNEREEFVDVRRLKGNTWSDIFYHLLSGSCTEQTGAIQSHAKKGKPQNRWSTVRVCVCARERLTLLFGL